LQIQLERNQEKAVKEPLFIIDQVISVSSGDDKEHVEVVFPVGLSGQVEMTQMHLLITWEAAKTLGYGLFHMMKARGLDPTVDNTKPRQVQ